MKRYTLYVCEVGRIADIAEMSCADDDSAVRQARQFYDGRAMVLWRDDRTVASWARDDIAIQGLEQSA